MRVSPGQWPADGSLPPDVTEFVEWLVDPHRTGSEAQWCRDHGYAAKRSQFWKKDKRVKDAIAKRADELNVSPERIQVVINAIYRAAERGDTKAAALYLQYVDRLTPKRVIIEDQRIEKLSDEELQAELASLGLIPTDTVSVTTTENGQYHSATRPVSFAVDEED